MKKFKSIKDWQFDDQPREKVMEHGISSLSNSELIALIIGSGTKEVSAVDVGKNLLNSVPHPMDLKKYGISDFCKTKGIGLAKAIKIMAAFEIAGRFQSTSLKKIPMRSSSDLFRHFSHKLGNLKYEEFWVVCLNQKLEIIATKKISEGGFSATLVDPKKIFSLVLEFSSSAIAVAHNHPSGHTQPSEADIELTKRLKECADLLSIRFLDHLIIGTSDYYSFSDEGFIV